MGDMVSRVLPMFFPWVLLGWHHQLRGIHIFTPVLLMLSRPTHL